MSCLYILILYMRFNFGVTTSLRSLCLAIQGCCGLIVFMELAISTLQGCHVMSLLGAPILCLRIVAFLLNERRVARITSWLLDLA
jgi:hypothetical protein